MRLQLQNLSNLNTAPCLAGQGVRGDGGSLQWAAETSGIPVAFSQPGALDSQSPGPAACLLWSLLRTALSGMSWKVTLCDIARGGAKIDLNYIQTFSPYRAPNTILGYKNQSVIAVE